MRLKAETLYKLKGSIVEYGFTLSGLFIILTALPEWEPREHWGILFTYTLLTIVSSFAPVRTLNSTLTLNNAVIFSGILLFGAWVGVWSAVIETLIISFLVRFNPVKAFANVGQILVTIWIVDLLKNSIVILESITMITDLFLAIVYWFVNMSLCAVGISYYFKLNWLPTIKNLAKGTSLTYLLLMTMGGISSRLVEVYGILAIIPMMAAFIIMSFGKSVV